MNIVQFLAQKGVTVSMSEGRRLVAGGSVLVNNQPEQDATRILKAGDVVSVGKKIKLGVSDDGTSSAQDCTAGT